MWMQSKCCKSITMSAQILLADAETQSTLSSATWVESLVLNFSSSSARFYLWVNHIWEVSYACLVSAESNVSQSCRLIQAGCWWTRDYSFCFYAHTSGFWLLSNSCDLDWRAVCVCVHVISTCLYEGLWNQTVTSWLYFTPVQIPTWWRHDTFFSRTSWLGSSCWVYSTPCPSGQ